MSDIAIIGMACVFPGAPDVETYWRNICSGFDAITDAPPGRLDELYYDPESTAPDRLYARRGGFVDAYANFDAASFGIMPIAAKGAEPDQLLALQVAWTAIADAGYKDRSFPREKTSIILGRGNYLGAGMVRLANHVRGAEQILAALRVLLPDLSEAKLAEIKADFQARCGLFGPDTAIGLVPNLVASRVANRLDLGGSAYTVDAACASSLLAVDQACRELQGGQADMAITGGVHLCHDPPFWSVLCQLGAVSHSQQIRPFDRRADGLLIGEGIGLVVLKRLAEAERDGDRIYAVIRGTGISSDGRDASVMSPAVAGQLLALERAWKDSGLDPATIGLIEAHGTGTVAGDSAEVATLGRFFGAPNAGAPRAGLGTIKSMIGHTMPAAGAAGLIKAALAVYNGVLPPTLHCEEPLAAVDETRFRLVTEAEPWEGTTRRAAVNAFGFGGINGHVIVDAHASALRRRSRMGASQTDAAATPLLVLAAASQEELLRALEAGTSNGLKGTWRLAVIDPTPERLAAARAAVEAGRPRNGRDGIFFSPNGLVSQGGKVAFLFPGVEARFEPRVEDVAAAFGYEVPAFVPEDLGQRGAGAFGVSVLLHRVLLDAGVRPDAIAGHSIGEWMGMIAAGILDSEAALDFAASQQPDELEVPDVTYVAVGTGAARARELIAGLDGVVVSHDNCEHQSIVCGPQEQVDTLAERLRQERVLFEVLPFRSGFHSPVFESYVGPYVARLADLQLHPPSMPLWSATTCEPYPSDAAGITSLFARHLVEPVRFRELIERLWEEGVRVFVQVGVGSLNAFVSDSLAGRPHVVIASNVAQRSGMEQLRWAAAALFVEGAAVDLERLGIVAKPAARAGMQIELGVPLIKLGLPPLQVESAASLPAIEGKGVMAEFEWSMREMVETQREVAQALSASPAGATPAKAPVQAASVPPVAFAASAPSAAAAPVAAVPAAAEPDLVEELTLGVETYPELIDHCLYPQPPEWPNLADRAPAVPITMSIALMREAAERLQPGRVAVGVERVVANSWLMVEPPAEVTLRASRVDADRVRVTIGSFVEGTVVLGDAYPEPPLSRLEPVADAEPAPLAANVIYRDRWLFHGPAYRGIASIDGVGSNGIDATLTALPAKGALMDAAGQVASMWILFKTETDRLSMPVKVERLEYFGAEPAAGAAVDCHVIIRRFGQREVRSDIELSQDGRVFARVTGWEDWRFMTGGGLFSVMRYPERSLLAEPQPGGFVVVHDPDRPLTTVEFLAGRFLSASEIEEVKRLTGRRRQFDWLYGRIAAKDAVRGLLFEKGHGPIFPVEVAVRSDDNGRPLVSGPFGEDIRVSLAHTEGVAVAIAAEGVDPGIDVEPVEARGDGFAAIAFTAEELALLPEMPRDEWLTRLWCAKEAVGKARGTGLAGAPKELRLTAVDSQRLLVENRWVETRLLGKYVVAWTVQ